jgi:hypothetical protein
LISFASSQTPTPTRKNQNRIHIRTRPTGPIDTKISPRKNNTPRIQREKADGSSGIIGSDTNAGSTMICHSESTATYCVFSILVSLRFASATISLIIDSGSLATSRVDSGLMIHTTPSKAVNEKKIFLKKIPIIAHKKIIKNPSSEKE